KSSNSKARFNCNRLIIYFPFGQPPAAIGSSPPTASQAAAKNLTELTTGRPAVPRTGAAGHFARPKPGQAAGRPGPAAPGPVRDSTVARAGQASPATAKSRADPSASGFGSSTARGESPGR